jgi:serine phosphatase RsbU (regulator of sigma subunit)/anti-sigma regulatory factor (Ser/Thr protein kinase)
VDLPSDIWLDPLRTLWRDATGGELTPVLQSVSESPHLDVPMAFPSGARESFNSQGELNGWVDPGGRRWWAVRLREGGFLAGWAQAGGEWLTLLRGWSPLLERALAEHAVAEGLTEELIQAWDRLKFVYHLIQVSSEGKESPEVLRSAVKLTGELIQSDDVFLAVHSPEGTWRYWTASGTTPSGVQQLAETACGRSQPTRLHDLPASVRAQVPILRGLQDLLLVRVPGPSGAEGVLGVLRSGSRYSASDVQLVISAAEQIGLLMDGFRVRAAREEARRLEVELSLAGRIQASMLPAELPEISGLEIAGHVRPAFHFGGDFYDIARAPSGEALLLLGDVSGKGIAAALLTALVHASFQSLAPSAEGPEALLAAMNRLMRPDLERAQAFVTAVVVRLDLDARGFSYASAGHSPAAYWRGGSESVEMLPATGLPLGIWPDETYEVRRGTLDPGDVVLLYSDGVTEALDGSGKLLGQQGLADLLYAGHGAPARDQIHFLLEALELYRGDRPLLDDVALLLVRRLEVGEGRTVIPFVFAAESSAVSAVVDLVRRVGEDLPIPSESDRHKAADDFALAIAEVVSNQVRHAYEHRPGRIQGSLEIGPAGWAADLYDIGRPFVDPGESWTAPDPQDPPLGGYGLHLVQGLVQRCAYRRLGNFRNHWRLEQGLPGG